MKIEYKPLTAYSNVYTHVHSLPSWLSSAVRTTAAGACPHLLQCDMDRSTDYNLTVTILQVHSLVTTPQSSKSSTGMC